VTKPVAGIAAGLTTGITTLISTGPSLCADRQQDRPRSRLEKEQRRDVAVVVPNAEVQARFGTVRP
jgi:hypothetical protein